MSSVLEIVKCAFVFIDLQQVLILFFFTTASSCFFYYMSYVPNSYVHVQLAHI
jgi:hypothetical protein